MNDLWPEIADWESAVMSAAGLGNLWMVATAPTSEEVVSRAVYWDGS